MSTTPITIHVDTEVARAYRARSTEERRKLDVLLSLRLKEMARPPRPLVEVMDEIGERAQQRGLTPEILDELLNDD